MSDQERAIRPSGLNWQQSRNYTDILYEVADGIARVTINRPERMNSLHPPANFELHEIWNDFEGDPDLWVGIVTGAGDKAFSAGNDLRFTA